MDENRLHLTPTDFPRHVSLKIDLSKKNSDKKLQEFLDGNESNLVRIQLHGTPEDVSKIDKSKFINHHIKWEDKSEVAGVTSVNLDENLNNVGQFMQWSKDIKQLDQNTIDLGLSIMEAVGAK